MLNKKKKYIFILLLFPLFIYAEDKPKDPTSWSVFQGKKNWEEAKNQCSLLGMKLPALSEIRKTIELGNTKDWEKYGNRYWSSERGDLFWSPDPQNGEADTYKSISLTGAEEYHRPESELGVFCINQSTIKLEEGTVKESRVIYPGTFTTKTGIKFTKILKEDGKPVYVSDEIKEPNERDYWYLDGNRKYKKRASWYFARDYAVKLNQEDNCPDCYRLPYREEIENLEKGKYDSLWLQSWSPAIWGMTAGNIWFGNYTFDYIHDIVFHPLSWQSYLYPISPDISPWEKQIRPFRTANRYYEVSVNEYESGPHSFRLVRPLR
jgi:hypothetical protein